MNKKPAPANLTVRPLPSAQGYAAIPDAPRRLQPSQGIPELSIEEISEGRAQGFRPTCLGGTATGSGIDLLRAIVSPFVFLLLEVCGRQLPHAEIVEHNYVTAEPVTFPRISA
jgi:hypothetical protein